MKTIATAVAAAIFATSASAATLSHDADDFTGTKTPAFGTLADPVATFFIDQGVDYSWGNVEGVFADGAEGALCGINGSNSCDLVTDVDGRIVVAGTTTQGLTSSIIVEAGYAAAGSLTLSVFDVNMNLITSAVNGSPAGPNGRQTMSIDLSGSNDIAFWSVSGADSYGVNYVEIGTPVSVGAVPLPAGLPLIATGMAAFAVARRRNKA
ncbi:hypothetical protein RGUI_1044 [Rhodovulum sp. P5]|uniref:VPLPA-CTERM sorting domain-containing protein n=1 Tax=Rhodovulum sp. P5 TaxID=1564506 RepID=UPI0009C28F38|nr:VPLPA-CTERM sorting domain-containing protein [Rhodovulum sp. P5]ARE39185.1 hypothetical protein RGUI_1044 [Rhodovulum sp. P5]